MAEITGKLVKELREKTGAGMMDCKKALVEVEGNIEKAIEFLREKGLAGAAKKSGRIAAEGAVAFYEAGDTAAIAEVNCETDFVAKNESFQAFVKDVAKDVVEGNKDFEEKTKAMIANIGENIVVRRYEKYELTNTGMIGGYIHLGGKIGVMVEVNAQNEQTLKNEVFVNLVKDLAMQIAASAPEYLTSEDMPKEKIDKEREILKIQAINEGKPEAIAEKMVEGRIKKMFKEVCLMDQPFVKDDSKSIEALLKETSKALNDDITIARFVRFKMGEGLEKKQENFAEEIAKQLS